MTPAEVAGPAGWKLRRLDRSQRWIAAVLLLLLAAPFAASAGRAFNEHWVPSGDEAVIAVRVHDSLSTHPPLTGLPSTSDLYGGGIRTRHLGPLEFYLLALPVRILGPSIGMLSGAGAINLGSVVLALWVVLRRAGPGVAAWASVVMALVLYSSGSAVLTDPISSNIGAFPLLCLVVLTWAVSAGDHRLLPVAAAVASFTAQQHLAMVPPVLIVTAWALLGLALSRWGRIRRSLPELWPWVSGAGIVGAVLWSPVAIEQFTDHPGNLSAVVRFARDSDRATLGHVRGVTQVLRVSGFPPWLLRHDLTGFDVAAPLSPLGVAAGVTVLVVVAIAALAAWSRRPVLAHLAATALVVAAAGAIAGSSVPKSIEADRINLYRWTWALALCIAVLFGWMVGLAAQRWALLRSNSIRGLTPVLVGCVTVVALVAALAATGDGINDRRKDESVFTIDRELGSAASRAVDANAGPVLVVAGGGMASLSVAPAIAARLAEEGIRFQVPAQLADAYGSRRAFDPASAQAALVVVSSFGPLPVLPGRRLAEADLNPDLRSSVDHLVASVRGRTIVPSARAPELLRTRLLPLLGEAAKNRIGRLASDPYAALTSPESLMLLADGYLARPELPAGDLARLRAAATKRTVSVWGDDRAALYLLTLDELRTYRPDLFT